MSEIIKEYNRFVSTFFLKLRNVPNHKSSSPLMKYYEWWAVYWLDTSDGVEDQISKIHLDEKEFMKRIIHGPSLIAVPSHEPKYYVLPVKRSKDVEIVYYRKKVELPGGGVEEVTVPAIFFDSFCLANIHMLYAIVLSTYEDPKQWKKVYDEVYRSCLWIMEFTLLARRRYSYYRGEKYLTEG
ncbi:MAG: hypothetical protein QW607_07275, partial [Desulfurococcaceae archaeon]